MADWWQITRWAFGVPDIIGDERARQYILDRLTKDSDLQYRRQSWTVADELLTETVKRAEAGSLDPVFIRLSYDSRSMRDELIDSIRRAAQQKIREDDAYDVQAKTSIVEALLKRLEAFMKEHPFRGPAPWG